MISRPKKFPTGKQNLYSYFHLTQITYTMVNRQSRKKIKNGSSMKCQTPLKVNVIMKYEGAFCLIKMLYIFTLEPDCEQD